MWRADGKEQEPKKDKERTEQWTRGLGDFGEVVGENWPQSEEHRWGDL